MKKVFFLDTAINKIKDFKNNGKKIVLVGGCFDILHFGHVRFLEKAKKEGDVLVAALESDEKVRRLKGEGRPIISQKERAEMLAALECVDMVILLPSITGDSGYFELTKKLSPDIIAVTAPDPQIEKKREQAKMIGGRVKVVTSLLNTLSTSKLVKVLGINP